MSLYRYDGQVNSVTYQGRMIRIKWSYDEFSEVPWNFCDYGNVTDWLHRDKEPGEVILCSERHGSKRFYHFAGAVAQLKMEGCSGAEADRIAQSEVKRFKDWCNDQWYYMNADVTIDGLEYTSSLGGIESDCADSAMDDLLVEAKSAIDEHQRNLVVFMRLLAMGVARIMYFNRYDIIEAHYWFAVHYHGGQSSELYAKQCRISGYFSPGIGSNGPSSENACVIYNNLELKHGHKRTHYKMLPCGEAQLV